MTIPATKSDDDRVVIALAVSRINLIDQVDPFLDLLGGRPLSIVLAQRVLDLGLVQQLLLRDIDLGNRLLGCRLCGLFRFKLCFRLLNILNFDPENHQPAIDHDGENAVRINRLIHFFPGTPNDQVICIGFRLFRIACGAVIILAGFHAGVPKEHEHLFPTVVKVSYFIDICSGYLQIADNTEIFQVACEGCLGRIQDQLPLE